MDNEKRIADQVARGMTRQQACMTLGIPYVPEQAASVDKDTLRTMAIDTLSALIRDMQRSPTSFKPTEIIAACKEALDRTEGKAAQSITVDTKATVTHEHVMKLPAAEAYRLLIEGSKQLTGLPVLEASATRGGGDTAKLGAGSDVGESPPHNTPHLGGNDIWK